MYVYKYSLQYLNQTLTLACSMSASGALLRAISILKSSDEVVLISTIVYIYSRFLSLQCFCVVTTISISLAELSYTKESSGKLFMALIVYRNGGYFSYDFSGLAGTPEATDCSVRPLEVAFAW